MLDRETEARFEAKRRLDETNARKAAAFDALLEAAFEACAVERQSLLHQCANCRTPRHCSISSRCGVVPSHSWLLDLESAIESAKQAVEGRD